MIASADVVEALRELRAAATEPPPSSADADDVIEAGAAMMAQRAKPFQKLQRALAKQPQGRLEDQESRALVESLRETDQRWGAALERARSVVGDRAGALRRMKQMKGGGYGKR